MKTNEGILGSAGVTLNDKFYVQHDRCGWPTQNSETTRVDLVGHAWFFKREWLRYLWQEKPVTWNNGEDIHFSAACKIYGGIRSFVPKMPINDMSMWGDLELHLGTDEHATWRKNNHSVLRGDTVKYWVEKGWKPLILEKER